MSNAGQIKVVIEGDSSSLVDAGGKGKQVIGDLGAGTGKAAEKTRLFSSEGREMHRVIGELNRISPMLGEALRIALHPVGGSIAAAIGMFVMFKREIDETNKKLDELGAAAAQPDFLAGIQAKLDILRNAAGAAEAYANKLADIKRGEHGVTEELKNQLDLDKAIEQARAALVSAQKGLDIAKIQAAEAAHQISPEKAAEARAIIEKKYLQQQQADHEAAQDNELKRKLEALSKAAAQQSELEAKQDAAADAESKEKGRRVRDEKDFGDEAYNKKLEELKKEISLNADLTQTPGAIQLREEGITPAGTIELEKSQAALKQLEEGRSRFLTEKTDTKTVPDLESANTIATALATANAKAFADLTEQVKQHGAVIAATRPIERQTTGVKVETQGVTERERVAKQVETDVGEAASFMTGSGAQTPEKLIALKRALQNIKDADETYQDVVIAVLEEHALSRKQLAEELKVVNQALAGQANHALSH